jgi:DNA repair protein RadC
MKEAGQFLELQLLDHVIVGHNQYFSFADEGLI